MPKSEYYNPPLLSGERDRPDIGIEAEKIYGLLKRADPMMNAADRRRYNDDAIELIRKVKIYFTLAYDFPDDRLAYLKKMWGYISAFIMHIRCMGEANVICIRPKYEPMTPDALKLQLIEHIGRMEEGATKWKNSVIRKGTRARPAAEAGTGSIPRNEGGPTP